jgi:protein-S-isoprenylcysteine O-methyltransferase Ste14
MSTSLKETTPPSRNRWIVPVLVLPLNVLIFIPAIILWLSKYQWRVNHPALLATGIILLCLAFGLAAWTMHLFHHVGKGTAAPWDPPQRLVVVGPYRHVRNPMLTSVFIMLAAETLLLNSCAIAALLAIFFLGNMLYFPLVEEKALEKRFGDAYQEYKRNVPRWLPRFTPWTQI